MCSFWRYDIPRRFFVLGNYRLSFRGVWFCLPRAWAVHVSLYIVDDNKEYSSQFNPNEHTIFITRSHIDDKRVILHEMIHAYEHMLEQKHHMLNEYLLLALYKKLSPLIPDLDKRLAEHGEMYSQYRVRSLGGYHGLLFYLKSLDLDIRCDYKLGTVCGYGRDTGDMWC